MENNKQTAVEFIETELRKLNISTDSGTSVSVIRILEQAKEMHKQQILNAFRNGYILEDIKLAEDYYIETYEKDTNN